MISNLEDIDLHNQYLIKLPKISQSITHIKTLYYPKDFYKEIMHAINSAKKRIYLVTLYLEKDQGGQKILEAIYRAKRLDPNLDVVILVDWYRAQRSRIGDFNDDTNANWYLRMSKDNPDVDIPTYGVPVNISEILGVLHLKGFIFDSKIIYSGASLNDVYLHQKNIYRYDRYHVICNKLLADTLLNYIKQNLLSDPVVKRLDILSKNKTFLEMKNNILLFRQKLKYAFYNYKNNASQSELSIAPIVGIGKKNQLNITIHHLFCSTNNILILYTPYFNLPKLLINDILVLLRLGKQIEIILGDKIANDFYISEDQPFNIIGILPYLYEINLRYLLSRLQNYLSNGQLIIRLWKNKSNSFHLKGIWVDQKWQLLTGNNFNYRAWRLDLENALLIHDPLKILSSQYEYELSLIRLHTKNIVHFTELPNINDYPIKIRKIIKRLRSIYIDRLINKII